uniref:TIGR03984 family CRISPR-associated protein n=1 Tax=Desulfatirhabdium butyrativorans TaxID=340467 RepID=A0A7C4RSL1_9BACT
MSFLFAADMKPEALLLEIASHRFSEQAVLMAYTPAEAIFTKYSGNMNDRFWIQVEEGRIFSPDGELRWRKIDGEMRTVYLGESPVENTCLQDKSHFLEGLCPRYTKFFLWGKRTDLEPEWIEQQIPRRIQYPIDTRQFHRGRVMLVVEQWVDAFGLPRFVRYHHVMETEGEDGYAAE